MLAVAELASEEVVETKHVKLRSVDRVWKEIDKANMQPIYPFEDIHAKLAIGRRSTPEIVQARVFLSDSGRVKLRLSS